MKNLISQNKFQLFIIIFLTFLAYSNIFKNSFIFDDNRLIRDWPIHQSFKNIGQLFSKDSDINALTWNYRPMRGIFFMTAYQLFGQNPFGYHLMSIAVHLGSTVLVYLIVSEIVGKSSVRQDRILSSNGDIGRTSSSFSKLLPSLPFLTALLFGLHPIHTEAITFITPSFDHIGSFFMLAAVWAYLYSKTQSYVASIVCALIAVFTYEITITIPLLLLLYDFTFRKVAWLRLAPFFAVSCFYIYVRMVLVGIVGRGEYLVGSFYLTMLTMTKAVFKYISLSVYPEKLSLKQRFFGLDAHLEKKNIEGIISSQSILDPAILAILLFLLSLLALGVIGIIGKFGKWWKLGAFGILWFFICLLPFLFIVPQGAIMQERYIYVASFGFCLVVAYAISIIYNQFESRFLRKTIFKNLTKILMPIALIGVFVFYGYKTYTRNFDWRNEEANWLAMAQDFPDDVQANYTTALNFLAKGDPESALFHFSNVITWDNELPQAYVAQGRAYNLQGKSGEAISSFNKSLDLDPEYFDAHIELAKLGQSDSWTFDEIFGLSLYHPLSWRVSTVRETVKLVDRENNFNVEFATHELQAGGSLEEYLASSKETFGQLVNQGQVKLPNFEKVYIRTFDDKGIPKLQFFALKSRKLLEILVNPSDSPSMAIFEKVLTTITM